MNLKINLSPLPKPQQPNTENYSAEWILEQLEHDEPLTYVFADLSDPNFNFFINDSQWCAYLKPCHRYTLPLVRIV